MANRFWVAGGDGLWSSTTNWSTTTGGASGASVPGAADQPVFDLNSGSGTSTLDYNTTNLSFYMTGFTGTLDFGIYTISVTGSGTVFQGSTTTTVLGTKTINVTNLGSTATTIALPGANTEANTLSFNFTAGTYNLSFLNALGTNVRNVDFTGFAGTWNARNQAVTIYGNLTLSTGMTLAASTGVVTLGATSGTQSLTFSGKTFNPINVNGVGGTVFFVDNPVFSAAPTLTNGTLDFNSRAITNQTWTMTTGSVVIKNTDPIIYTFSITQTSGTLTLGSNCAIGGTYTLTSGTLSLNGYALTCGAFSSSNSNTRTIAFGSGSITCKNTGGTLWTTQITTNFSYTGTSNVIIDNNTALATTIQPGFMSESQALNFNIISGTYALTITVGCGIRNLNFVASGTTGFGGTTGSRAADITLFGSITLSSNMTHAASTLGFLFAATSGTQIITSNGKTFDMPMALTGVGGTTKLADAFAMGATRTFNFNNGNFDGNGQTITGALLLSASAGGVTSFKGLNTTRPFTVTDSTTTLTGDNTTGVFGVSAGTLNFGTYILTATSFASSTTSTRALNFSTSTVNVTNTAGGTLWTTAVTTGLTVTGTPVVNISNAGAVATSVLTGVLTEANAISFNFINGTYALTFLGTASYSAKNVNFTGFAGTWNARSVGSTIYGSFTLSTGMTFAVSTGVLTFGATSGTQIITSNGKTIDEPITINGVGGTVLLADALTMGSTRTLTLNNGTFDAANKTVSGMSQIASNLASGNITIKNLTTSVPYGCNSSTITVTLGTDISVGVVTLTSGTINLGSYTLTCASFGSSNSSVRTIAFGTGNITCFSTVGGTLWNTATSTNLTISGTPAVNITYSGAAGVTIASGATTEATVLSFNITAGTYILTFPTYFKSVNFTGFSGSWTSAAQALQIFGDVTFSSTMTVGGGNGGTSFVATSGIQTITSNGKSWPAPLVQSNSGATLRLADALTQTTYQYLHNSGTLDLNGKTLTPGTNYTTGAGTKDITFNGGTLSCGNSFNNAVPAGFTTTAGTGVGKISMTRATAQSFTGGGSTYNCTLSNDGAGALNVLGSNTFTTIANGVQPTAFTFTAGTTQTVTNWNVSGTAGNLVTIISSAAGTPATLSKASGIVSSNYLSLKDSTATGGATWYAGANSTDVSGNSGWIFSNAPSNAAGSFFFMF